jgi:hypothetical protein
MCCYLLDVDEPQLKKPANQWCQHCTKSKGCGIYAARPDACRVFACMWLVNENVADIWFPKNSKIVIHSPKQLLREDIRLQFSVDPRFPNRWREEPYFSTIKRFPLAGLSKKKRVTTHVDVGQKRFLILPHREVENCGIPRFGPCFQTPHGFPTPWKHDRKTYLELTRLPARRAREHVAGADQSGTGN